MLLVSHSKFSAHLLHASYMYIDKGRLSHNPVRRTEQNLRFNPILRVLKIDANSETLCRFDTVKFKRL